MKDIIYKKNVYYNEKEKFITLKGNTIIVPFLHRCYSHAIMDNIFPLFWILKDIKKIYNKNKFNLFIKHSTTPFNNIILSNNKKEYIGAFNELLNLFNFENIIFEHNINNVFFENAFFIDCKNDMMSNWQRGVWNCSLYYKQRNFSINDVYFTDEEIYTNLKEFVKFTKNKYNIIDYKTNNEMLIIERKNDRKFDKLELTKIINNIPNNINYKIVTLEDMTLKEQITLFSQNNIFLFRHGSCLINLLWAQENSIVFDLDIDTDRPHVTKRVCQLTNSQHHYLKYTGPYDEIKTVLTQYKTLRI